MFIDAQNRYSASQAVTAAAVSQNTIDHSAPRDLGVGEPLYIVVTVKTAFTDAGSDSTLAVQLQTAPTVDGSGELTAASTIRTLFTLPALSPVGQVAIARIQPGDIDQRHSGLNYAPNNGDLTTGAVESFITRNIDAWKAYPDLIVIS